MKVRTELLKRTGLPIPPGAGDVVEVDDQTFRTLMNRLAQSLPTQPVPEGYTPTPRNAVEGECGC
jgi:hypothetical protein